MGENADAGKAANIQDLNWFYGMEMTGLGEPPCSTVNTSTEPKACSALCSQNQTHTGPEYLLSVHRKQVPQGKAIPLTATL